MAGALSIGVYLLPAVGLWCAAASVQAREAGWAVIGPSIVFGLGLTVLGFAAAV